MFVSCMDVDGGVAAVAGVAVAVGAGVDGPEEASVLEGFPWLWPLP